MAQHIPIYDQLKQDHLKVSSILHKMVTSDDDAGKERKELTEELKHELIAHAHAEEHVLYEELEKHKKSKEVAIEGEEEHHLVEHLFEELQQTDTSDPHWRAKAILLQKLILQHVAEEETEVFSKAQLVISQEQAEEMGERFNEEKRQEQQRM